MQLPFLPEWVRVVWAVLLLAAVVAHATHVRVMSGQRRWWHVAHTAMAAAMMLMYLVPPMSAPMPYRVGLVVFACAATAIAVGTVLLRRREGTTNPLWVASGVDMLAMTYMLLPMGSHIAVVSYGFVGYLVASALAWVGGLWKRAPAFRQPLAVSVGGEPVTTLEVPSGSGRALGLTAESSADVPVTLAVMAAGMAYMLAVM